MRHLLAIGGLVFICIIAIPGFWLARKSKAALEPGILSAQVDKLVAGWTAQNTPASNRVVDLIISDAQEAEEEKPEDRAAAYSSGDMEVLSTANKPSGLAKMGIWFRRTFFRRSMSAGEDTAFVESFSDNPNAITWTHKGEETASEEEMAKEFMRAILKADDAGAEINIITQGAAAVAALKAMKILKNVKRPDGHMPTVSKVVAVGMNRPTLQRIDSPFFRNYSKPDNLREIVYIWNPPAEPKKTTIEIFSPRYNGKRFDGAELFPMMGGRGTNAEYIIRLVTVMAKKLYAMEEVIGRLEAKIQEKKQAERAEAEAKAKAEAKKTYTAEVVSRDLLGRAYKKEAPKPAQPMDSLSAIGGGWLKEEAEKADKETKRTQKKNRPAQTRTKQADNKSGNRANCKAGRAGEYPRCDWYDAMKFCNGGLPTVNQLKAWYNNECTGGRQANTCSGWYWSSEEYSAGLARRVNFLNGHVIINHKNDSHYVRCQ